LFLSDISCFVEQTSCDGDQAVAPFTRIKLLNLRNLV
jgi:hypothetical protein